MKRLLVCALLAACSGKSVASDPPDAHPRLVVLLVIDQWPEWAFEQKRPALHAGGFDRLLAEGTWRVGRHPTIATLTGPGHALLGTGALSATSGIVANEWWHRDAGRVLKSVEAEDGSVTAKWLRVPGLGDAVAAAKAGGRAVAVSLKDRAAVLPLGHHGTAIWYEPRTVDWQSTTNPAWLAAWNHAQPIVFHLHDVWEPLDAGRLRALSGRRDGEIGEVGEKNFGPAFPHALDRTKYPADAVFATPLGNDLVVDTAEAAIAGEHLGADAVPDVLVLSLSAHDYIAHGWGQESWELWDATLRLDARLARFLEHLDRAVGAGRWAMIVTSDHGGCPLPELVGGGRLRFSQVIDRANAAAVEVLGPGTWVVESKYPTLYLADAARARPPAELDRALERMVAALRDTPGIARAERTATLAGNCAARPEADRMICVALDPERSGELLYIPARGWVMEEDDEPLATAHGSPYDYDQLVPVIELAPGRTPHASLARPDGAPLETTQIAPLLRTWLGL